MQCNYLNPERKMFASKSGSSRFSRFSFQIHSTPGVGRLPALHGAWGRPVAPGPEVQPASSTDSPGLFLFLFLFFIGCAESFAPKRCGEAKPFSRFLATTGCDEGRGPRAVLSPSLPLFLSGPVFVPGRPPHPCPRHSFFPPSGSQGGKASSGCHSGPFVGSPGLRVSQPPPPSPRPSVALEAASKARCEVCFDTHKRAARGSSKRPGMVSPSQRGGSKEKTSRLHLPVPRG